MGSQSAQDDFVAKDARELRAVPRPTRHGCPILFSQSAYHMRDKLALALSTRSKAGVLPSAS